MEEGKDAITIPKIYGAIAGVIADIGYVAKDKMNKQQGFKFRSVDDVYNALHPALAKNKVFIVPEILDQTRDVVGTTKNGAKMTLVICKIKFTFYAEDGSHIETNLVGEALDTGDKATNKAMAIAYKYACFQVFCIPTEEMTDPDLDSPEISGDSKNSKGDPAKKTAAAADRQPKAEEKPEDDKITQAMINTLHSEMDRTGVLEKVIVSLFKVKHIEEMTTVQFDKAMKKLSVTKDKKEAANE